MQVTLERLLVLVEAAAEVGGSPGLVTLEGDALDASHGGGEVLV